MEPARPNGRALQAAQRPTYSASATCERAKRASPDLMRAVDIIRAKRDGEALSREAIDAFVRG